LQASDCTNKLKKCQLDKNKEKLTPTYKMLPCKNSRNIHKNLNQIATFARNKPAEVRVLNTHKLQQQLHDIK